MHCCQTRCSLYNCGVCVGTLLHCDSLMKIYDVHMTLVFDDRAQLQHHVKAPEYIHAVRTKCFMVDEGALVGTACLRGPVGLATCCRVHCSHCHFHPPSLHLHCSCELNAALSQCCSQSMLLEPLHLECCFYGEWDTWCWGLPQPGFLLAELLHLSMLEQRWCTHIHVTCTRRHQSAGN